MNIFDAVKQNNIGKIKKLLDVGDYINYKNEDGNTPLHCAASHGPLEICEFLIKQGADVNAKNNYGNTPLHRAAYNGYLNICELLIKNGADVNAKNNDGSTPLRYFIDEELDLIKMLLNHGATL